MRSGVVEKLMDGTVDNLMDNLVPRLPPGCRTGRPQASPRRVVWMSNNRFSKSFF